MSKNTDTVIIRAKELAASGGYQFVYQIERVLLLEGYINVDRAFRKFGTKSELRAIIAANGKR